MNEIKHSHHGHEIVDGEHIPEEKHPYWRRAHRDWRFWVVMLMFVAAITLYVTTDNLALVRRSPPQPAPSSAAGK
jgi:hypothetical protein